MGMTAIATAAIAAIAGGGQMIMANQQAQHAKGAQEAQQTAMNAQLADQDKTTDEGAKVDAAQQQKQSDSASATRQAAISAMRASLSTTGQMGGTILTGGSGAAPAATASKTLLGI